MDREEVPPTRTDAPDDEAVRHSGSRWEPPTEAASTAPAPDAPVTPAAPTRSPRRGLRLAAAIGAGVLLAGGGFAVGHAVGENDGPGGGLVGHHRGGDRDGRPAGTTAPATAPAITDGLFT